MIPVLCLAPNSTAARPPGQRRRTRRKVSGAAAQQGLRDAILMILEINKMVMERIDECHALPELLSVLDVSSKANTRLATLLKAERLLSEDNDIATVLSQALSEVWSELRAGQSK